MSDFQRPFLKWAGNKYQVLPEIWKVLPTQGKRFIEPFAGSGSVFLNVTLDPALTYGAYAVGDSNPDLMDLYELVKKDGQSFLERCRILFHGDGAAIPSGNDRPRYEHLRDVFNAKKIDPALDAVGIGRSEMFVYLNRHCFNGLCRYNSKGKFNVPFGRYKGPSVPHDDILLFHKQIQSVTFTAGDYTKMLATLNPGDGDVVYLDPPYVPLSATASFTDYSNDGGFPMAKQEELAKLAEKYSAQGAVVLVSNHDTTVSRDLYKNASSIHAFEVTRFISAAGKSRNKAPELIAVYK